MSQETSSRVAGPPIAFDSYFRPQGETWLSLMSIDGSARRKIQAVSEGGSYPKWSPDSTRIAFSSVPQPTVATLRRFTIWLQVKTRVVTTGTIESWVDNDHILVS